MAEIAMILAGGQGSRLSILSEHRAKPAVPFGGNYRIIDFVLSNVMHSGIRYVGVLTQYKPYSLMAHIGSGEAWGFSGRRSVAKVLPPYMGKQAEDWYAGTADAIYQNLSFISRFDVDTVVVLSGDHIYNMAYADLIATHERNRADLTVATQAVPWEDTHRFGILSSDSRCRIESFEEKPKGTPTSNQANLGVYVFNRSVLEERLRADAENPDSSHDFGKDIIPLMVNEERCYAYEFRDYWRDVGTLQSYWEANMECLAPRNGLDLTAWRVLTNSQDLIGSCNTPTHVYGGGTIVNSLVGKGSVIRGMVVNSVLSRGVEVGEGAEVRDSVLMDGVRIGAGAKVRHLIADKNVEVGAQTTVGEEVGDPGTESDSGSEAFRLLNGLSLMGMYTRTPEDYNIGRNCLVYPDLTPDDFPADGLVSTATVQGLHRQRSRRQ